MKVAAETERIEGGRTVLRLGAMGYFEVPAGGHVDLVAQSAQWRSATSSEFLVQSYCSAGVEIDLPVAFREP